VYISAIMISVHKSHALLHDICLLVCLPVSASVSVTVSVYICCVARVVRINV